MPQPLYRRVTPYAVPPNAFFKNVRRTGWIGLQPQDRVLVKEEKKPTYEAVVDMMTEDLTVVWVIPSTTGTRRAFHSSDDVDITVVQISRAKQNR